MPYEGGLDLGAGPGATGPDHPRRPWGVAALHACSESPQGGAELDLIGLDRPTPPLRHTDPPMPAAESLCRPEYLWPAGFNGSLGVGVVHPRWPARRASDRAGRGRLPAHARRPGPDQHRHAADGARGRPDADDPRRRRDRARGHRCRRGGSGRSDSGDQCGGTNSPSRRARAAAVVREGAASFARTWSTCSSTVRAVIPSPSAIRWLDAPVTGSRAPAAPGG